MSQKSDQIYGVPTNIITGFLGSGKTSTILQLLKNKPSNERWAVLVNEFGEIGIDGALFEGQYTEGQGIYIREVPGGCMCCTAGQPMRVALTQLLKRAKPDRLLIEPTGLGHPKEVLQTLREENFKGVLAIQKIITLLDARHLSDNRYTEHDTFKQQIAIADIIVGNKKDLYSEHDKTALSDYLQKHGLSDVTFVFAEHGVIEHSLLDGPNTLSANNAIDLLASGSEDSLRRFNEPIPECGFIKAINKGEGFTSIGWRFSKDVVFDKNLLFAFLSGVDAERLKATFITNEGCFAYNVTKDALTETAFDSLDESRIEILAHKLNPEWEDCLFNCKAPI